MVGINEQGNVKVWVHKNYAENKVENSQKAKREADVVGYLCRFIKEKVFNNSLKYSFPFGMNFSKAKVYLEDILTNKIDY